MRASNGSPENLPWAGEGAEQVVTVPVCRDCQQPPQRDWMRVLLCFSLSKH